MDRKNEYSRLCRNMRASQIYSCGSLNEAKNSSSIPGMLDEFLVSFSFIEPKKCLCVKRRNLEWVGWLVRRRVRPNCPFLRAQLRCIRSTEGCFIVSDERSQNLSAVATNFSRTQGASLERQAPRRKCGYRLPRPGVVTGFRNRPSTSSRPASAEVFDEGLLRGDNLE